MYGGRSVMLLMTSLKTRIWVVVKTMIQGDLTRCDEEADMSE